MKKQFGLEIKFRGLIAIEMSMIAIEGKTGDCISIFSCGKVIMNRDERRFMILYGI